MPETKLSIVADDEEPTATPETETPPTGEEAETSVEQQAQSSEEEQPQPESEASKYLGRFSSEEEALKQFGSMEKRITDEQAFIEQLKNENSLYRAALLKQASVQQPAQAAMLPSQAQAGAAPVAKLSNEHLALIRDDPEKFYNEALIPMMRGVAEEAAKHGTQYAIKQYEPALHAANTVSQQRGFELLWEGMEKADPRFSRTDSASGLALNQALRDFSERFGGVYGAGGVSDNDATDYIYKTASLSYSNLEKSFTKKASPARNVVQTSKAVSSSTPEKSEKEIQREVYKLVAQNKLNEALALKRKYGLL